jgi:predicted transcriptional regulator
MREFITRATTGLGLLLLQASHLGVLRLRQMHTPLTAPALRALTLCLGVLLFTSIDAAAQFTLTKSDPSCELKSSGVVTLANLTPGTMYTIQITSPGSTLLSATYTANAAGQIVFQNLTQGAYSFDIATQTPQVQSTVLYDLNQPISATTSVACVGARSWINPFHNDEVCVTFPFNSGTNGTSKNTTYLGNGTSQLGSGLTSNGIMAGCTGMGQQLTGFSSTTDHTAAFAAGDYIEFTIPVSTLKYDLTNLDFGLRSDAGGPTQYAIYFNNTFVNSGVITPGSCATPSWVGVRTFQPGQNMVVRLVAYGASSPTGTLFIDQFMASTPVKYNIYSNAGLSSLVAMKVDSFQTPPINVPTSYWIVPRVDGCSGEPYMVTVNPAALPTSTISVNPSATVCTGTSVTLTASPTVTGETYLWNTGATMQSINVTTAGTYTVTVTNAALCTAVATQTITVNTPAVASISGAAAICSGATTTLTASAGASWLWSTGATTQSILTGIAGTYTVAVTDANNCVSNAMHTLTVNANPTGNVIGSTSICAGKSTTLTASGGTGYIWSTNDLTSAITVSPTANTSYTVTISNAANCTDIRTVLVTVNALPTASIVSSVTPPTICAGDAITLTAGGGISYNWSTGSALAAIALTPAATTTYTVTATDANGCTDTEAITVNVNSLPTAQITGTNTVCSGSSTTLTASGGTGYMWSNGVNTATNAVAPLVNTTYTVTVSNGTCSSTTSTLVTVNAVPTASIAGDMDICNGQSTQLTAAGGGSYAWAGGPTSTTYTVTPTTNTNYTVTVTAPNGCTDSETAQVVVNALPTVSIAPLSATICAGTMATLTASGASTYIWSNSATTATTTVNPTGTTTYTVTGTDGNGCVNTASVPVTVTPLPVVTISPDQTVCAFSTLMLFATGGTTYQWNQGSVGANITVSALSMAGTQTYIVTVTNNGCSSTASSLVTTKAIPNTTIQPFGPICNGGTALLIAQPNAGSYTWSTGATTQSISVSPTANTTYTVTVTIDGCSSPTSAMVTVNPLPQPVVTGDNDLCAGESTTLTATGGTSYLWSTGANTDIINVTPTATTTYTVEVTNANGCKAIGTRTVAVNPLPVPQILPNPATVCSNSTQTLTASGGGTYLWSANANSANTATVTVLPTASATTYSVTVTSAEGCVASTSREVTPVTAPVAAISAPSMSICKGTTVTLTASGGGTYAWSNAANQAVNQVSPGIPTTYTVTVTNAAGCTDTETVMLDVRIAPVATGVVTAPSCINGNDGRIDINVTGGQPISSYNWTTNNGSGIVAGQEDQNTLTPGDYVLVISNQASCDLMLMFNVPIATGNTDVTAPSITCTPVTVYCPMKDLTPAQLVALGVPGVLPTVSDNCDATPMLASNATQTDVACGDLIDGRPNISHVEDRTWLATDNNGNSATCVSRIYYERVQASQIVYPTDKIFDCTNATTGIQAAGVPTFSAFGTSWPLYPNVGYCELNFDTLERISPICGGSYKITRTWKLFNWCPNTTTSYEQVITVMDNNKPTFTCPSDVTISTDPQNCKRNYDLPEVLISDACSNIASFTASWTASGSSSSLTGTLTDFSGNNLWQPDTMGNMGIAQNLPVGTTSITYSASDACTNVQTCSFNVTVVDQIPPSALCKSVGMQISLNSTEILVPAATFNGGSSDNCSPVYFKVRRMDANSCQAVDQFFDRAQFCCSDRGNSVQVVLRVYDIPVPSGPVSLDFGLGHFNDCMTTVVVEDKLKPTCPAPPSYTIDCENFDPTLWAYDTLRATDNCGIVAYSRTVDYTDFDSQCKQGTILRTFTATDVMGMTCSVTQTITVTHNQDYYIKFPDDIVSTTCNGSVAQTPPVLYDVDCEQAGVSLVKDDTLTISSGACYEVIRTWRVANTCTWNTTIPCTIVPNPTPMAMMSSPANLPGPIVAPAGAPLLSTIVRVNPSDPTATDYTTYWSANANCYEYKQRIKVSDIAAPTFTNCSAVPDTVKDLTNNDATLWNEMGLWDNLHMTHNLGEAAIDINTSATDACSGNKLTFTYQLFLDLDGNGTMETVVNSATPPAAGTVRFNNATTQNFAGGVTKIFDNRNLPTNQLHNWAVEQTLVGGIATAQVRWNTTSAPSTYVVPQLPYGTHKIKWFVHDGCGNQTTCERMFTIRDHKAPTIFSLTGVSTNIMPTGMVMLNLSDLVVKAPQDNMTDSTRIKLSFQIAPAGNTFPLVGGLPVTQLTIACAQIPANGLVPIVIWAMDLMGNMSSTNTTVLINDNTNVCPPQPGNGTGNKVSIAGSIDGQDKSGQAQGVQNAEVKISGTHPTLPALQTSLMTGKDGKYTSGVNIPAGGDYMVSPYKNDDPLNGVNILDVLLMQRHILGLDPLSTPLKIIAADINKSGSVTSSDIVELRKVILGANQTFPQNTSWRFVDKSHQFANPFNPFANSFKEYISWQNMQANQDSACFAALKVGDLNNDAVYNALMKSDDRSNRVLHLQTNDRTVSAGEVFEVPFTLSEAATALQFTLNYSGLILEEVIPTDLRLTQDHFAVFADLNALTFATDAAATGFKLRFRAQQAGKISQMIQVNSRITQAIAVNEQGENLQINARFGGKNDTQTAFAVYQNAPNPMRNSTVIGFHLPETADVTLTITDETGRTILVKEGNFAAGYNAIEVLRNQLNASGLYFYTIRTGSEQATMRMIVE